MLSRNQIFLYMVFILVAGFFFLSTPESSYAQSDCCFEHDGLACDDEACSNTVCDMDDFCCDVSWDSKCVSAAEEFCEVCGGTPPLKSESILTLSQWGLIAMAGILGIIGFIMVMRRRKVTA